MLNAITITIDNVTIADWVAISIALTAVIVAIVGTRKSINLNKLITLIQVISQEVSNEEASKDRSLVKDIKNPDMEEIKRLVLAGRRDEKTDDAECGKAIERTIAHFDRVSFFLLGNGKKPLIKPPIWLWTLVSEIWEKFGEWIKYRQTCIYDTYFYHKGYGYYLEELEEYRSKHKNGRQPNATG
jgi:hypothetical protein